MAGLSNGQIVGLIGAVVLGGMVLVTVLPDLMAEPEAAAPPAPAKLGAAQVAECRKLLDTGRKSGIIRARPAPNRIDVEDHLWALSEARTKEVVLRAVACDVWQMVTPPPGEFVVSYGARSGKRIEMLSEMGIDRE